MLDIFYVIHIFQSFGYRIERIGFFGYVYNLNAKLFLYARFIWEYFCVYDLYFYYCSFLYSGNLLSNFLPE